MTKYFLWILQFMGVGNPRSIFLLHHFGTAENVYNALQKSNLHFLKPNEREAFKTASLERSEEIIKQAEDYGYKVLPLDHHDYPYSLRNIANPPLVIFARGEVSELNDDVCITVVGSRNASEYSYKVCERIITPLAKNGVIIVSGMAVGIDKAAHTAALVEGKTAGVLASGFDVDYPKGSMEFRDEIVKNGGIIITEQLPGGKAERGYFYLRNRIMSALSLGTLIIEAGEDSGCLITANHAIDQNRDLFCIPPADIFDPKYSGVIPFLRDGATPIFHFTDILGQYSNIYAISNKKISEIKYQRHSINSNNTAKAPANIITDYMREGMSPVKRKICELLANGVKTTEYLKRECGFTFEELSEGLLDLEIDGIIAAAPGAAYKMNT